MTLPALPRVRSTLSPDPGSLGPPFPPHIHPGEEGFRLGLCRTFAVIVLRELIARPAAAVPLAAERTHSVDAGLAEPAAVGARDALVHV